MTWHYLDDNSEPCTYSPERAAASSQTCSLDTYPSALSKLMPTRDESCLHGSATDASRDSAYGMMLRRSPGMSGADGLMWYAGDSPVRTYLPPAEAQASEASDLDCGPSSRESLAKYNPATYSWKTAQCSLLGGLMSYSETFPRWGTMRDGELYPLPTLVRRTYGNEYGFFVGTPTASMSHRSEKFIRKMLQPQEFVKKFPKSGMWPTPTTHNAKECNAPAEATRNTPTLVNVAGGTLNPTWVEWLMGWPLGWTDLSVSATAKFREWQQQHGACLEMV